MYWCNGVAVTVVVLVALLGWGLFYF